MSSDPLADLPPDVRAFVDRFTAARSRVTAAMLTTPLSPHEGPARRQLLADLDTVRRFIEAMDKVAAEPGTPSNTLFIQSIPEDMLDALRAQVAAGDPILAILDLRARLGCTLAIAKRLIEEAFGPQGLRLKILPDGTVEVTR